MRELVFAIAISVLPFAAQAEGLPVVLGDSGEKEQGTAREIASAMAANPRCTGVSVIGASDGSYGGRYQAKDHWQLELPLFQPGGARYEWSLQKRVGGKPNNIVLKGVGTPRQIAEAVCVIVER
jgi:hypothetical protein